MKIFSEALKSLHPAAMPSPGFLIPNASFAVRLSSRTMDCISLPMTRPCFLVIDKQYPGSISTRKLVIETALLNVLTAYSAEEAIEMLKRFPQVDGIVLDTEVPGLPCHELIGRLRSIRADIPIISVSPTGYEPCNGEQFHVSSYDPQDLLDQLQRICSKETLELSQTPQDSPAE